MSHVAAKVREQKEKQPERYCAHKDCLWRMSSGGCPKHPTTSGPISSADVARVRETTPVRSFTAENEDGSENTVMYSVARDSLHCQTHKTDDGCSCSARVRLSGILTHSVVPNVKYVRFDIAELARVAER